MHFVLQLGGLDPGRSGAWNEITIRNCDLYDEPLTAQTVNPIFNGAFPNPTLPIGQTVSENAIDTKHVSTSRGILRLQDLRMRGFTMTVAPTFNASALVLKENVDVIAERCRASNCKIGWRVRSPSNSMQCKLDMVNCWTNNCATGFRLEDALSTNPQQIRLAHNTFDANTATLVRALHFEFLWQQHGLQHAGVEWHAPDRVLEHAGEYRDSRGTWC